MQPTDRPELPSTHLLDLTDKIALVTGAGRGHEIDVDESETCTDALLKFLRPLE